MTLARTPDGYIPTFNIRKGMKLLSKGEWITAESDSTEIPAYQYTFHDNTYTYSKYDNIVPQSCNIPLPFNLEDKAAFVKGYHIQNNLKFPFRTRDKSLALGLMKITMEIPKTDADFYIFNNPDMSYDYSNTTINNMVNGIMYHNLNLEKSNKTVMYYHQLTDLSVMIMHLASIQTESNQLLSHSYKNFFRILYSANPTEYMINKALKQLYITYTNDKVVVNVNPTIIYGLQSQDFDINNFSSI